MKELKRPYRVIKKTIGAQKLCVDLVYKLSSFVVVKETEKHLYLYHTLTTQCRQLDLRSLPKRLLGSEIEKDPELKILTEDWFYVKESLNESQNYYSIYKMLRLLRGGKGYPIYYILPTSGCNARCPYCYEEGMRKVTMTEETALATASFIVATHRKNTKLQLFWYGGEPLLGEKAIDLISDRLRNEEIDFSSCMITNGSLINDKIIWKMKHEWATELVQISMDCAEEEYIKRRNYYHYHDEYHSVMEAVNGLAQNGIQPVIRCNVDLDNIDKGEEFLGDLKQAIREPSKVKVYFAPLFQERKMHGEILWKKAFELADIAHKMGFSYRFDDFPACVPFFFCPNDGTTESVTIDPLGRLFGCSDCIEGTSFGDVRNGITDSEKWKERNRIGKIKEKCENCAYLPICTPFEDCPFKNPQCDVLPAYQVECGFKKVIEENEF